MAAREYLNDFASYTTLAGFPRIIASKATPQRIAWIIVFTAAWVLFTYQMSSVLQSYFEYPKKLKTEIVPSAFPFPDITLCNLGSFDFYTVYRLSEGLASLHEPFYEDTAEYKTNHENDTHDPDDEDYEEYEKIAKFKSYSNDSFIRAMYKYYHVLNDSTSLSDMEWKIYYDKMFSRTNVAANLPIRMLSANGYQKDEFIVKCTYMNKPCRFKEIFDPYFFNCYTFTALNVTSSADYVFTPLFEGIENGFTVMLLAGTRMLKEVKNVDFTGMPGIYAKDSALSGAAGVRVVIHPPGTKPFPLTEGYDIPPGRMATLSLTPKRRIRLDQPYGHCNEKYSFLNHEEQKFAGSYRKTACEKVCIQNYIFKECNCYENTLPTELDLLSDDDDDVISSNYSIKKNFTRKRKTMILQDYCLTENYLEKSDSKEDPCKMIEKCSGTTEFHQCFKFYNRGDPMCNDEVLKRLFSKIKCAEKAKYEAMSNATILSQCRCHPSCNETLYDVSYSLSQWPSDGIDGETVGYEIMEEERYIERFSSQKKKEFYQHYTKADFKRALKDFSKINVYVSDDNVFQTEEEPAMTPTQLISDIGGQLGVWIGVCVITFAEALEVLILIIMACCRRRFKKGAPDKVESNLRTLSREEDKPEIVEGHFYAI